VKITPEPTNAAQALAVLARMSLPPHPPASALGPKP
jgi:hypothetical protein